MKIGLYFGSFNPIHVGHLIIASHVLNETDLQRVWFVVSPQNPLKKSDTLLNEYDRLNLVHKAVNEDDRFKASDIEFNLPRPSYTVDTLAYLRERFPKDQFSVIMGSDSFRNIERWKNPEEIVKQHEIIVYERPGFPVEVNNPAVHVLKAPLLEISATHIRRMLAEGKSIKYLLHPKVEEEILKGGYYQKLKK